jgi:hypothetical protein
MDNDIERNVLEKRISCLPFFFFFRTDHIRKLTDSAMRTEFSPGQNIFLTGEAANRFYIIESGKAEIAVPGLNDELILVQVLNPGEVLGWSWLYPPHKWNLSASAVGKCGAISFYGTHVLHECKNDVELSNDLYQRIAQVMLDRMHHIMGKLVDS